MSIPENKLAVYRTYSYHHFLVLCSTTAAAESVGDVASHDFRTLQHPTGGDRYAIRGISGGSYITLVDGMSDAHLNVTKASWSTIIAPDTKTSEGSTVGMGAKVDGVIDIFEPNGASLIGIIGRAAVRMGVPHPSLSFVLKTIFIGERHDGGSEYISNVKPFIFTVYDMSAVFNSTGSKYRMISIGQVGNSIKGDHAVLSGSSVKVLPNEFTLNVLKKIEDQANKVATDAFKELQKQSPEAAANTRVPKYRIKVAQDVRETIAGTNTNIKLQHTGKGDAILNLSRGKGSNMAQAIETVLVSSRDIMSKSKTVDKSAALEKRDVFTVNQVTTIGADGGKIHTYWVGLKEVLTAKQGQSLAEEEANFELDYIFTGKNTDIINLDMKLTKALNVILMMSTTGSVPSVENTISGTKPESVVSEPGSQASGGLATSPTNMEVGHNFERPYYTNVNYPAETANFYHHFSNQAEIDSIGALITIHGNPGLLDDMTVNPGDMAGIINQKGTTGKINSNWMNTQIKLKLNVKFPVNPDDITAGFTDFWYLGLYQILSVQHDFKDGKFTQTIKITPIAGSSPTYDGSEPKGGTTVAAAYATKSYPNRGIGLARNASGELSVVAKSRTENFIEIKALVEQVAEEEGVDPNLILGIIKQESSFRVSVNGPATKSGTARGLMQLLPTTAEDMGVPRDQLYIPTENIRAGTRYIKWLLGIYDGDLTLALAAYNAGLGNVGIPPAPASVPNFPETIDYVAQVPKHMEQFANGTAIELRREATLLSSKAANTPSVHTIEDAGATSVKIVRERSNNENIG